MGCDTKYIWTSMRLFVTLFVPVILTTSVSTQDTTYLFTVILYGQYGRLPILAGELKNLYIIWGVQMDGLTLNLIGPMLLILIRLMHFKLWQLTFVVFNKMLLMVTMRL